MKRRKKSYDFEIRTILVETPLTEDQIYDKIAPILERIILRGELLYTSDQIREEYDKIKDSSTLKFGDYRDSD